MPLEFIFWLIYLLALIFAFVGYYPIAPAVTWRPLGGSLLFFVLIGLLGWKVFGFPVRG